MSMPPADVYTTAFTGFQSNARHLFMPRRAYFYISSTQYARRRAYLMIMRKFHLLISAASISAIDRLTIESCQYLIRYIFSHARA